MRFRNNESPAAATANITTGIGRPTNVPRPIHAMESMLAGHCTTSSWKKKACPRPARKSPEASVVNSEGTSA